VTFSEQISSTRASLALTQAELARALDVDGQTVSNWECGRTVPWPKHRVDILGKLLTLTSGQRTRLRIVDRIS
jgi:transcriptional regulator with XRE-family HTH domain